MVEIGGWRRSVGFERGAQRREGFGVVSGGDGAAGGTAAAQQSAAPVEPELLVADLALVEESEDGEGERGVGFVAA